MIWTTVFLFLPPILTSAYRVKIGRVCNLDDDVRFTTEEFWSYSPDSATSLRLEPVTQNIQWWNTLDAVIAVCKLAENGVKALVVEGPPRLSPLIATYSMHMQLPSVGGSVHIIPDTNHAAAQLIRQWKSFAFIYQTEIGVNQLQEILRLLDYTPRIEAFWRTNGAKETLDFASYVPNTPLVLACSEALVDELLSNLVTQRRSYEIMLLTPVGSVRKSLSPGSYRLIQFSYVDQESPVLKGFENRWKTIRKSSLSDKDLPVSAILNHEASKVVQSLLAKEKPSGYSNQYFDCFNYSAGIQPSSLKEVYVHGSLTGNIEFNSRGQRVGYKLNIYEEKPFDLKKIGEWSEDSGLKLTQTKNQMPPTPAAFQNPESKTLRVTSILNKPFLFEGPSGNLEGFTIDLLEVLQTVIHMSYRINLVKDGKYGFQNSKKEWTGMIGELLRNEADIAVSDLTKTMQRETVVDFSKPFMSVGLNIVLKKPDAILHETSSFGPFSFLTVWSVGTCLIVVVFVIVFGACSYLISRYIGSPDRVRALESKGTDNLSPCGSMWFTLASLLQRDTGIYPRTFSHRVWACLWWAMCFFLAVTYVSYLSAALLQTRRSITTTHSRKTSQEVIQDLLEKGKPDIGAVFGGSTQKFFLNSNIGTYQSFGRYLERNPDLMTPNYDEGIKRVRESDGSYAYICESPSSQYHANVAPCDIYITSGYLTTKTHAIALQKKSPYKDLIDHGILFLMETGILQELYEKWWHNYSDVCEDSNLDILPKVYNKSLRLHEVSGVFYILILIALVSVGAAFVEKYTTAKKITLD